MTVKRKNCTIRELAQYVGLSTCTVSKVLNDRGGESSIPQTTRDKVRRAAQELHYVPNINAQRFFKKRSFVIGLLVPPQEEMGVNVFRDTHFVDILSGIEKGLADTQYNLLLLFNRPEYRENNRYEAMFSSGFLDGMLVWGAHRSDGCWKALVEFDAPRIFLTSTPDFEAGIPLNYVISDYENAAFEVTSRLLRSGCRRFGWLAGKPDTSLVPQFLAGMKRAGVVLDDADMRFSDYDESEGYRLGKELLSMGKYDALLCSCSGLARGATRAAGAGLNVHFGSFDCSTHTVYSGDQFVRAIADDCEIGLVAVQKLMALMEDNSMIVHEKIPMNIVESENPKEV